MLTNEGGRQKRSGITIYGELTLPRHQQVQSDNICCAEP